MLFPRVDAGFRACGRDQRAIETDEVCGRPLDSFAFASLLQWEKRGLGERMTDQHAGIACRRHQLNRAKGSREELPCRVQGQRPCWGLGQRPNCSASDQSQGSRQQRCRQRSVPASNFALPQERPQAALPTPCTLSRQMGATDQHREKSFLGAGLFCCREISPLRRRPEGFAVALWTASHPHLSLLAVIAAF